MYCIEESKKRRNGEVGFIAETQRDGTGVS